MFRNIYTFSCIAFIIIQSFSCEKSLTNSDKSELPRVNIIADLEKFDRTAVEKDPFHIDSVYVSGDLLHIVVRYGGGCEYHDFDLYSTNGIYLSMPPQGDVFLGHDANGDLCEAYLSEELIFDLTPLIAANPDGMGLRLHQFQAHEPFQTIWWRTDQ